MTDVKRKHNTIAKSVGIGMAGYTQHEAGLLNAVHATGTAEERLSIMAQLRAAANVIPAHVWYATASGGLAFVNSHNADYGGLPHDHPLRFGAVLDAEWDSHIPFLHPDDQEETRRVWSTCLRTGSAGEVVFRVRNAEGGYRWFLSRAEPVRAADGTVLFWIGVHLDIDEQKRAEQELRDILDSIPAIVWVARPDGSNTYVNSQYAEYTGLTPAQTAGTGWRVVAHPDDLPRHEANWRASIANGNPHESEVRFRRADGQYRWHLDRGHPLRDEKGDVIRWYGVVTDIEDRKRSEQALLRNDHFLAEAQKLSHTGSFGWQPGNGEIYWSDETYRIFEYDRADHPTLDMVMRRIYPQDRSLTRELTERASKTSEDFEHECRLLMPSGAIKHIHVRAHALDKSSGDIEFVGAISDITAQKEAALRLQQQETELRQVLDLAPQLIAVFGPHRERLYLNRVSLDYFGITLDQWCEARPGNEVHPDDTERLRSQWDHAISNGSAFEIEVRFRRNDGIFRWFLIRSNPVRDEQERVLRWYSACTDIEDRKRAEDKLRRENTALREELNQASMFEEIVGSSEPLRKVLSHVNKVALSDSTVLILGQTGTGKELIARAIHKRSRRAGRAFIGVNCAAIPASLIASELFGHEKGAFTGATHRRLGRFEAANGGTIFLDEIGDLPQDIQIALLRVLQEREIERVGSDKPIPVDVRVLAATHRDLNKLVSEGKFREDLLYRLNVVPITMPSLRARAADIPILVEYFLARFGKKMGKKFQNIDKKTLKVMQEYEWPGNVRELQNVIERAVTLSDSDTFVVDEAWLKREPPKAPDSDLTLNGVLQAHEKEVIEVALAQSHGRISGPAGAAAKLGIPDSTLEAKIKRLGIDKYRFKSRTV
jgi:formate hydrogenlyase transcriptional activator